MFLEILTFTLLCKFSFVYGTLCLSSDVIFTPYVRFLDLNLRKKLVKCYILSMALYGAETWTLRAVDQKHVESFEM
jgi:hypothetical protein